MPEPRVDLEKGQFHPDRLVLATGQGDVHLTPIEGRLLAWLARHPDETHGVPRLLGEVWGYRAGVTSRTVYTTVGRLRAKIELDPDNPRHVVSVPGLGYRFEPRAPRPDRGAPRTVFLGRDEELARLAAAVGRPGLVSVIGPGGCGKTRLVRTLVAGERERRVVFCDLSTVWTADEMIRVIAAIADVPIASEDAATQVGRAIASFGRCVLVLDNLEQLGSQVEAPIATIQRLAPEASVVVTSRDHHRLPGEVLELEPLAAPVAAALFVARARDARPDFEPEGRENEDIDVIVRALDGLPLAVELAAARMAVLSPSGIRQRLEHRFRLLRDERGRPDRHATLLAAITWSWELLSPWEQAALAQLSAFSGGFSLEAAEAVLDLSPWPDAPWAVDVVQSLYEKSLLTLRIDERREPRFGQLVSIQAFAADRLRADGPDAEQAVMIRHGRWFSRYGTLDGRRRWRTDRDLAWSPIVRAELDNLLVACRRAVARGDGTIATLTSGAVALVCERQGPFSLAISVTAEALAIASGPDRALALAVHAESLEAGGRPADARRLTRDAIAAADALGDAELGGLARGLAILAGTHGSEGANVEAEALALLDFVRAHDLSDQLGPAETRVAVVLMEAGRAADALPILRDALAHCAAAGDLSGEAIAWSNIANACRFLARIPEAADAYERALDLHQRMGNRRRAAVVRSNLAGMYEVRGDTERARALYEAALADHREIGNLRSEAFALVGLARLLEFQAMYADADAALARALAISRDLGLGRQIGFGLVGLAQLRASQGRDDEALAAAEQAIELAPTVRDEVVLGMAQGPKALVEARRGRPEAARAAITTGEATLRRCRAMVDLAVFLGHAAEAEAVLGDFAAAEAHLAAIAIIADEVCPAPSLVHARHGRWSAFVATRRRQASQGRAAP